MASIKEIISASDGKPRFVVHYKHEITGSSKHPQFRTLDGAAALFWDVEESALSVSSAESAEDRQSWTLQKLIWFYLGYLHNRLNDEKPISLSYYNKSRATLLAIDGRILSRPVPQISRRELEMSVSSAALNVLRAAFIQIRRHNLITTIPFRRRKKPRYKAKNIPSRSTIKKLLKEAPLRERIAAWFGAVCGLRIGEILALTYRDITEKIITVNKHIVPRLGSVPGLKTSLQRQVPMPRALFSLLNHELMGTSSPVIAQHRTGRPMGLGYSNQGEMRRVLDAYGISRFHDLRHFAVSILIERGVNTTTISNMIGHSKPSVTTDVYGHLIGDLPSLDYDL